MKENITLGLGRGTTIAALATFGLVGAAQADWSNHYGETGVSGVGYFTNMGSGGKSPEFDSSRYDQINLGSIASTQWAPKRGAQGPVRQDEASAMADRQARELEKQLGPIGGRNTP